MFYPLSIVYQPDSLWASQGTPFVAADTITWSQVITPGTVVLIGFQAQVAQGNTVIRNSALVDVEGLGVYRSNECSTTVPALCIFMPLVFHSYCGPAKDDFSDPNSGWPITTTPYWSYKYINGEYQIYAWQGPALTALTRGDREERYSVEVDVRQLSAVDGAFGLVFALADDWSDFYTFEIYPPAQQFDVWRHRDGDWSHLRHYVSSAIRTGQSVNHLRVGWWYRDNSFGHPYDYYRFYINGIDLGDVWVSVSMLNVGDTRVGFVVTASDPGLDVRFDNYKFLNGDCVDTDIPAMAPQQQTFEAFQSSARGR